MDWATTYPFTMHKRGFPEVAGIQDGSVSRGDVIIGNDVWIGYGATIMSGVTIGNGAVIAAHAVVTKDVPEYGIAAGNPARTVRFRFDMHTIRAMSEIAWWNWPEHKVRRLLPLLCSDRIDEFIAAATAGE